MLAFSAYDISSIDIDREVDGRRLRKVIPSGRNLSDNRRFARVQTNSARRNCQKCVMADTLKYFMAIVLAEIREDEVNPLCVAFGKLREIGEVEAVGGEPEAVDEEDGDRDVVNS